MQLMSVVKWAVCLGHTCLRLDITGIGIWRGSARLRTLTFQTRPVIDDRRRALFACRSRTAFKACKSSLQTTSAARPLTPGNNWS